MSTAAAAPPPRWTAPSLPVAALHLAALWSLGFVQPLLDLLSHNADFFIARGNSGGDIVRYSLGLVLLPPAAMVAVEALAGLISAPLRVAVHAALVAVLAAAVALEALKRAVAGDALPIALALLAGAAFAVAAARAAPVRSFLTVLGPAPLVFLALFLLLSPIAQLLRPEASARAAAGPAPTTPVVLVIFDELPAISLMGPGGRIDAARFPAFGRLARASTWYRNATTVSDSTTRAVPAILSGLRPRDGRLPTARSYPRTIFTLLGGRYEQHVVEPVTDLCPVDTCAEGRAGGAGERLRKLTSDLAVVSGHLLLPDGLAARLPPIDRGWADFTGDEQGTVSALGRQRQAPGRLADDWWAQNVTAAARGIEVRPARGKRPPAYVVHFILPHVPWRYLPTGARYPEPGPNDIPGLITGVGWGANNALVREGWQRHLLQVGFADRLVGRLMASLRRTGLWDRALVVVTADHGGSFRPDEARRPVDAANFADIANVPLFVKQPFQRSGRTDDGIARTIDILPTIREAVGGGERWHLDGTPLDRPHDDRTITVNNHNERRDHRLAVAAFLRARDAQLAQQLRIFPPGPASLYAFGPEARLLGRTAAALARSPAAADSGGTIDRAAAYRDVDPRTGVVPAFVTGRLGPREPAGQALAIAVDGRIRATTRSYRKGGTTHFAAMVPPSALGPGAHAVHVYAIAPGGRALREVARTPAA